MLAVNDLFYLTEPVVKSLFCEDVVTWLDEAKVRYTPKIKYTGTSGYEHLFDFVIPKSCRRPEGILRTINRPSRATAETFIHAWSDTREVRSPESEAYAMLNDREQPVVAEVPEPCRPTALCPCTGVIERESANGCWPDGRVLSRRS